MELALNQPAPLLKRLSWFDWLFAVIVATGGLFALSRFGEFMDIYEKGILLTAIPALAVFGWFWKPFRTLFIVVGAVSLFAISQYHGDLARMDEAFFLKYLIASQAAIMWMCALFGLATLTYWAGLLSRSEFTMKTASAMTWSAVAMGFIGLMVRWYESYLIGSDVGHIPVSNLYEVFVLFCLITAMLYLYFEARYQTRQMGAFVLLVISAAVGFILWYALDRDAQGIQPLVPALKSWWMKLHVPANFIGYGSFSISAMLGAAYLLAQRGILASRLPRLEVIDDIMYKSIAIGFAFFTIATILGAMWAAEAWGGYWSWDPKETWALIVWLNYAGYLHARTSKGWRGKQMAWWSFMSLWVVTFCFLGVNLFLSGLHSYGKL